MSDVAAMILFLFFLMGFFVLMSYLTLLPHDAFRCLFKRRKKKTPKDPTKEYLDWAFKLRTLAYDKTAIDAAFGEGESK